VSSDPEQGSVPVEPPRLDPDPAEQKRGRHDVDLWTALFTVFRRWYVSLPIAVLAVVGMVVIGGRIAQEYEAHASVVLVPPPAKVIGGIERRPDNPLDAKTAATATAKQIDSTSTQRRFEDDGLSPDFEVNLDSDTAIIEYLITAKTADQALETAQRLIDETKGNLARIQQIAGAQDDALITLNTVDISDEAEPIKGDKLRVQATVLLLGLVAAVSAAFIVESFQTRRRGGGRTAMPATPGAGVPMLSGYPVPQMPGGYAVAQPANGVPGGYPTIAPLPPGYVPVLPMAQPSMAAEADPAAARPQEAPAHDAPAGERALFGSVDDLLDEPEARNGLANGHGSDRRSSSARPINTRKRTPGRDEAATTAAVDHTRDTAASGVEDAREYAPTEVADTADAGPFDHEADPVAEAELVTDVEPTDATEGAKGAEALEPAEATEVETVERETIELDPAAAADGDAPADEEVIDLTTAEAEPEAGAEPSNTPPAEDGDARNDADADAEPEDAPTEVVAATKASERATQDRPRSGSGGSAGSGSGGGRPSRARRGGGAAAATKRQTRPDHSSGTAGKERRSSLFASGNDAPPAGNDG
jgi:hypothetical protein